MWSAREDEARKKQKVRGEREAYAERQSHKPTAVDRRRTSRKSTCKSADRQAPLLHFTIKSQVTPEPQTATWGFASSFSLI